VRDRLSCEPTSGHLFCSPIRSSEYLDVQRWRSGVRREGGNESLLRGFPKLELDGREVMDQ
jgi:hypothetical protein